MKTLNIFYPVIYWTQEEHNDFIFLCSIVLPPIGHSSNHKYHWCQLTRQSSCGWNFYRTFKVSIWLSLVLHNYISILWRITTWLYRTLQFLSLISIHSNSLVPARNKSNYSLLVKVKWSRYRPGVAQRVGRGIALLFHDRGTRRG